MNRIVRSLVAVAVLTLASVALAQSAPNNVAFKNYTAAGKVILGSRPTQGAQLGSWDPAVSGSIDTGYIDTAGCSASCLSAMIEVETATTSLSCSTYGAYDTGSFAGIVSNAGLIGSAVTVSASSKSWANSVCPGAATSSAAIQAPLPKYVRIYCAAVAGVNARAFLSCH